MRRIHIILLAAPVLFSACTGQSIYDNGPICLTGGLEGTKAGVAAVSYTDSVPSADNPLNADIWFSTTKDTYPGTGGTKPDFSVIDVHRTISYTGSSVTTPSPDASGNYLHYPASDGNVWCVGLYPQNKWTKTSNGKGATASINGEDDLMYAVQKEGKASKPFSASPQIFRHQLTWVKIRVRSLDHTAGDTWGHIRKIELTSADQASVNFTSDVVSFSSDSVKIVAFEGDMKMPIPSTEIGSIFASPAPKDGSGKCYYNISITCDNNSKTNVKVPLTDNNGASFTGNTSGKVFVLTLYFQPLSTISFTTQLSSWEDEGRELSLE